ncbi:hypothetical protein [Streptomyces sp. Qhu_M48]|uniref:hypothetical protein n=1 Tax=Streptomyces sp. Qhu_M48 TaxID=3435889 RepID=UPI003F4F4C20
MWSLADQLGVVARSPAELVEALARDPRRTVIVLPDLHEAEVAELVLDLARVGHARLIVESRTGSGAHQRLAGSGCAELDLDLEQWRDQDRFEQWRASWAEEIAVNASSEPATDVELADPGAICRADPWQVTAAYEKGTDGEYGGLRTAWLKAGQALCRQQSPASRALILLSVLGDSADPRCSPALKKLATGTDWGVEWSRVRGDMTPPWPGPVSALATGRGPLEDSLLVAGAGSAVRTVQSADASARGRVSLPSDRAASLTASSDGTVLYLDEHGHLDVESAWAASSEGSGIAGLLDDGPTPAQRLADVLRGQKGTSIAYAEGDDLGTVVLGDRTGAVRSFGDITDSVSLHEGMVTALGALTHTSEDGATTVPLVYSGGQDGTVRAWSPGHEPMAGTLMQRSCPVVAMDAAWTASGPTAVVAWADGLVEWINCETGAQQTLRLGPPVRALAMDTRGRVFVGMDEALTCLVLRRQV